MSAVPKKRHYGRQQKRLDRSAFLRELKNILPELRAALNRDRGSLHQEVFTFHHFTQDAIVRGDSVVAGKCFKIAERFLTLGNHTLSNALSVSFVEHLSFSGDREWAWASLPMSLKQAYVSLLGTKQPTSNS